MGKYFGTDGFRAQAGVNLTADEAFRIGRYLGALLSSDEKRARIVIGKDTRRSSYMLEYSVAAGIVSSGADAYLLHVTTTPSVSYVVKSDGFDAGIMISASHNPYTDNGIKLIGRNGEKSGDDLTDMIEEYLDGKREDPEYARGEKIGRTFDYSAGRNRYIGYLISLATRSFSKMRIGLDCANGSAWMIAKSVFDALGAETFVISNEPDGTNINRNCGSTDTSKLVKLVKENSLDVGFAFDGDADRCIAVDENGNVVDGDGIMYISAKYLKKNKMLSQNKIVVTVMSNMGLDRSLEKYGISTVRTSVGDRFVYEEIAKGGYSLGGEESGHIVFAKYASSGDGILTAIKITEIMLEEKSRLSDLEKGLSLYPHCQINQKVNDKDKAIRSPLLLTKADELRSLYGDYRIILRKSGTEPVIRIFVEGPDEKVCKEIADALDETVKGGE